MTPRRLLFVFHWLVVGGEETEVRLLAHHLAPDWTIDVVVCHWRPSMPGQTHEQLVAAGIPVDTTPYALTDDKIVDHLVSVIPAYDAVVACQAVPFVHPALQRLHDEGADPPPLVEHGGLVREALTGPKELVTKYVGVCAAIRDAAASRMPDRPEDALEIPSMVDLVVFDPADRAGVRAEWSSEWGIPADAPVVGWVGRLDRKKRVEDVLDAAAILAERHPRARWLLVGGPNFFYPDHEQGLHEHARRLGLGDRACFLGDRPDVPRLMSGMDVLVWLSEGEGMPHVVAEAGAARLPVVLTRDHGSQQQVVDGQSGVFVPSREPAAAAAAVARLLDDPALRRRLGDGLRRTVEEQYAVEAVVPRWRALLDELTGRRAS